MLVRYIVSITYLCKLIIFKNNLDYKIILLPLWKQLKTKAYENRRIRSNRIKH